MSIIIPELSKNDQYDYWNRLFQASVEISNTTQVMREFGDDEDLIKDMEALALKLLDHMEDSVYNLEQEFLTQYINKNIDEQTVSEYMNILKGNDNA